MRVLKAMAKRLVGPRAVHRWRSRGRAEDAPAEAIFDGHYASNHWADAQSVSGPGSTEAETARLREQLRPLLDALGVRSMLDAPCGDFHWMRQVDLAGIAYVGGDIVRPLVAANTDRYGGAERRFVALDICTDPLPEVDLILCRDCLFHLRFALVHQALANFAASGARWLLTTTHPATVENVDIATGDYRPLNLAAWPFRLPPPERLIYERPDATFGDVDKALGLWKIEAIRKSIG